MIQYQILQTSITRAIWQAVRRITNEILRVLEWSVCKHLCVYTCTWSLQTFYAACHLFLCFSNEQLSQGAYNTKENRPHFVMANEIRAEVGFLFLNCYVKFSCGEANLKNKTTFSFICRKSFHIIAINLNYFYNRFFQEQIFV